MDSNLIQLAFNQSDENVMLADYIMQGQQINIFKTYINGYGDGYGFGDGYDGYGNGYKSMII